jgi:hypothetical protein
VTRLPNLAAAETFIWLNARLLDRHRYTHLFKDGDVEAVLAALRPYQNTDGGFGHALEPDGRGAGSQPLHVYSALEMLDQIGHFQDQMVTRAVDSIASVTADDGGVPAALPSVRSDPRAPWFNVDGDSPPGSLLPTAGVAGLLHKNQVKHLWLQNATSFSWRAIEALEETHPYELDFCLTFLNHVPDRDRAEREAERLGRLVRERRLVARSSDAADGVVTPPGYAPDEVHTPLDYAQRPTSLARRWFSEQEIEMELDALADAQDDDGGWYFNWRQWNSAATLEWRGWITVRALTILMAYGRMT